MGAHQTPNRNQEKGVSFQLGTEKAHIIILKQDDLAQRNAVLDVILNLSTLRHTYQLAYLAAPRLFGAGVDSSMFSSRGIGLLLYDERRIDEAVPAQPLHAESQMPNVTQSDDKAVVTELASLKTMYLEMERTINQLRTDITTLLNTRPPHEETFRVLPSPPMITPPETFHQNGVPAGDLPSYFMNNPWLDVLSKRGSGSEPVAG
ncbi:MAG TPA: hypothetical protein VEI80_04780 [Candidatus Acidoferrales bacterium]|nr:hypothetical protein [Candidatus Acidoferrales bacterium]